MIPVAKFSFVDTSMVPFIRAATDEFIFRASDGRAIALVRAVSTILVAIAVPSRGNTSVVLATELTAVARREI